MLGWRVDSPSRRCHVATLVMVGLFAAPPGRAEAADHDTIEFDDVAYCDVRMDDPHLSGTVAGDVSVRVGVNCFRWNTRENFFVTEMRAETKINYFDASTLSGGTLGVCPPGIRNDFAFFSFPCHARGGGAGMYIGVSTVTVTIGDESDSIDVSKSADLDPTAIA